LGKNSRTHIYSSDLAKTQEDSQGKSHEGATVGSKTPPPEKLFNNQVLEIEIVRDFRQALARESGR
jgi:hypothetical protein